MSQIKKAKFRCWKCAHEWENEPGPTSCPRCQLLYATWVNYGL